jgi:N-carbamoylputrescine amidase
LSFRAKSRNLYLKIEGDSSTSLDMTKKKQTPAAKSRVALIQMRCGPDPEDNLAKAISRISDAAGKRAQIVCLPELFRSQYFCQSEDHANFALAEKIPGPTTAALSKVAREKKIVVIGSIFEKRSAGVYHNTAVVIDADGKFLGRYRKMHIPDDPAFYEKFYFTPGDLGFKAWSTAKGRIGVCVCWDQWYPEAARLTALHGAEILFYPTAIGWHPSEKKKYGAAQHSAWETIQRSHAIANGCYVAAVNRVGHESPAGGAGIEFWGQSFVAAPSGEILAKGSVGREEIVMADIDWSRVEEQRTHWPFLRDRRIDAYSEIKERMID